MDDAAAEQTPEARKGDGEAPTPVSASPAESPSIPTPGFSSLVAPDPVVAAPPVAARVTAFAAICVGGLLGGLVGYGIGSVLYPDSPWSAVGAVAGALTGAVGLGVLANLTLRAMNEWRSVTHPESSGSNRSGSESGR